MEKWKVATGLNVKALYGIMEDTTKLNKSKLGTKQYWDEFYALERKNFEDNAEDTGECWFSENNAEERMVEFLLNSCEDGSISSNASVIDLGTGNGHLLFSLLEKGFNGVMVGVDYSKHSVEFANQIRIQQYKHNKQISFYKQDIFCDSWNPGLFDVVIDKGTLDAIALSGTTSANGETVVDMYYKVVEKIIKEDGIFMITSCNFTEEELIKMIKKGKLKVWKTIQYPTFEFNGVNGSSICTVVFVKAEL